MNNKTTLALSQKARKAIKRKKEKEEQKQQDELQKDQPNFVLVQQQAGLDIPPLQHKNSKEIFTLNKRGISGDDENDEYQVIHSEDVVDTHFVDEPDDDGATSDHLVKTFGPTLNDSLHEDILKVADRGGLSPRGQKQKKKSTKILK